MARTTLLSLSMFTVAVACGPPKHGDEAPPLVETQCDAFCDRAIACESEEFAQTWEFATQSECLDGCLSWTRAVVDVLAKPSCETILGDEWECGSTIEECDVWRSFEDDAFGKPPIDGNPCQEEQARTLD